MVQYSETSSPLGRWEVCGCGNLLCMTRRPYREIRLILESAYYNLHIFRGCYDPAYYELDTVKSR